MKTGDISFMAKVTVGGLCYMLQNITENA